MQAKFNCRWLSVTINWKMLGFMLDPDRIFFMHVQNHDPPPNSRPLEQITISER